MERWLPIAGYEGLYEVSDLGRVRHVHTLRVKQPSEDRGYLIVGLCAPGRKAKRCAVHRLVLSAFVGPPPTNHDGGHLDGSRSNNRLENLAWVSRAENQLHRAAHGTALWGSANPNARLSDRKVAEIRALSGIVPSSELAQRYGVGRSTIQKIARGESWNTDSEAINAAADAALKQARLNP